MITPALVGLAGSGKFNIKTRVMSKENFKNLEALVPVQNVINEAEAALNDSNRTIADSSIPDVLGAAGGALLGGAGSFAALYFGGTTAGLSAAGITSGLAAAGGIVGGGMAAGVFVLAAPVALLGICGYAIVKRHRTNKLNQEKARLYNIALQKHQAIINELKNKAQLSKERADYLERLNILLRKAIEDLQADLNKAA